MGAYEILRKKRLERNMSIGRAAQITGITKPTYIRIERGTNQPSINAAYKIKTRFGIDMEAWVQQ